MSKCKALGNKDSDVDVCATCEYLNEEGGCPVNKAEDEMISDIGHGYVSENIGEFKDGKYIHVVTFEMSEEEFNERFNELVGE